MDLMIVRTEERKDLPLTPGWITEVNYRGGFNSLSEAHRWGKQWESMRPHYRLATPIQVQPALEAREEPKPEPAQNPISGALNLLGLYKSFQSLLDELGLDNRRQT